MSLPGALASGAVATVIAYLTGDALKYFEERPDVDWFVRSYVDGEFHPIYQRDLSEDIAGVLVQRDPETGLPTRCALDAEMLRDWCGKSNPPNHFQRFAGRFNDPQVE